jgi:hypothetical protein
MEGTEERVEPNCTVRLRFLQQAQHPADAFTPINFHS